MEQPSRPLQPERPGGPSISIGTGWLLPAALVTFIVATGYLPAHGEGAPAPDALLALAAALYVAGLAIVAPRAVRALVLRLAGEPVRLVLLGTTGDELSDPRIAARWRLLAILSGALVALLTLLASVAFGSASASETYRHAIAMVAANVALLVVLGSVVPAPPYVGWSLLLTILDGIGVARTSRARRAAPRPPGLGGRVSRGMGRTGGT